MADQRSRTMLAWQTLVTNLRRAYDELIIVAAAFDHWDAQSIGGAFALVAHSAYHLGEVRQGLGVVAGGCLRGFPRSFPCSSCTMLLQTGTRGGELTSSVEEEEIRTW